MTLDELRLKVGNYAEVAVPFDARLEGRPVVVTAVLERTAVYHAGDYWDRQLAPLSLFEVDSEPEIHMTAQALLKEQSSAARGRRASALKRKVA